ncbi:hypothetical protein FQN50_000405 [Emmonsiellopsis sp. PD_5]|nr:hypothetical protein FQN50_000405 [Emmonsiellopsis sp. PD_5]
MASRTDFGEDTTATEVASTFSDAIKGRTILITGVNPQGIGGATAHALASHSPARLLITGRSQEKLNEITTTLRTTFPSVIVTPITLDLSSQHSIRTAAAQITQTIDELDLLINNAGVMAIPTRQLSDDGFELHLATNHIGPFLLTNLLLDKLRIAATKRPGTTRVVNVTSGAYPLSPFRMEDYNFDGRAVGKDEVGVPALLGVFGLPTEEPVREYQPMIAYGQSKTGVILFAKYLAERERLRGVGVGSFAVHPGEAMTELGRHLPAEAIEMITKIVPKFKSHDQGASTTLVAALDPALKDHSGAFLMDCQVSPTAPFASDLETAEKVWKLTESFVKEEFKL